MKINYDAPTFKDFFIQNEILFMDELMSSFSNNLLREIDKNLLLGKNHLIETCKLLVENLGDHTKEELLKREAESRGRDWSNSDLDISLKLEYFTIFRKKYWSFRKDYQVHLTKQDHLSFDLEYNVNHSLDIFINEYVKSYTDSKNKVIELQKVTIDDLTAPIIPLTDKMAVLPIVGKIDSNRAISIHEQTLSKISSERLEELVIDLSGVVVLV